MRVQRLVTTERVLAALLLGLALPAMAQTQAQETGSLQAAEPVKVPDVIAPPKPFRCRASRPAAPAHSTAPRQIPARSPGRM